MARPISIPPAPPATRREAVLAWLAAIAAMPLAAMALAGPSLFDRPFWSDEVLSWLIASDADFGHGLAALAGGVDTNAPLLHVLFRIAGEMFGHTPLVYRLTCTAGMSVALAGLYLALRFVAAPRPAIVACLFFWSLPIVVSHTTEARFYSWFVAAAVWTCYLIHTRRQRENLPNTAILALASAALCGIHYFGIAALGCIAAADVLTHRTRWHTAASRLFPMVAGVATTLCLLPLLITQRSAMASVGGTWVPDDFVLNLKTTLVSLLPTTSALLLVMLVLAAIATGGRARVAAHLGSLRSPMLGLLGFAIVILAFDRLVQPVLVPRYFVVMLPGVALLVAGIVAAMSTRVANASAVIVLIAIGGELLRLRGLIASPTPRSGAGVLASVRSVDDVPIVSDWLGYALPIWTTRPELREQLAYLSDLRLHDPDFAQAIPYEREMAACVHRFYGLPRQTDLRRIDRLDRFVLLSEFPESIAERFAGWQRRQLGEVTFELTREPAPAAADAD